MAIRFMRQAGHMPQTSTMAHIGKGPASSGVGSFSGPAPLAPPPSSVGSQPMGGGSPSPGNVPGMHPMLPWLMMAIQAIGGKTADSGGKALVPDHPVNRKLNPSHATYQKSVKLPGASTPHSGAAPAGEKSYQAASVKLGSSSPHVESSQVSAHQGQEAITHGQAITVAAPTIERPSDGRSDGVELSRPSAALGTSNLVHPKQRMYQKAAVQRYALKRPLG